EVQTEDEVPAAEKAPKLLMRLSLSDLLKIGLSQNHFRTAGILTALGLGFLDDLQEALGKETYKEMEQSLGAYFESVWTLTLVFVTTLLVLSFLGTMILTV
ncbi:hypothetical protein RZS08_62715, partial [Arthrospira platensis SPKY1]|nr:hypothetical protein [Arthrospira platensis SPKY1]